ncbi:TPA: hypothetical protein VDU83_006803 [Pseudomonas aeruginosa]|nr:hypothetical protein [Pseudomonas aeruginosa]
MSMMTPIPSPKNLTAKSWQLYTASMQCDEAAKELSAALEQALMCQTEGAAWAVMGPVMEKWAEHGATDSEPRRVVRAYMNATYPSRIGQEYVIDAACRCGPPV